MALCVSLPAGAANLLSVNGTITLAEAAPAPDGCDINVYLQEAGGASHSAQSITVYSGDSTFSYSLYTEAFDQGTLWYSILGDCGDNYPAGYYTGTTVSHDYTQAAVLSGTGNTVNFTIPLGRRVNGQVKLPGADTAGTDIVMDVTAGAKSIWYNLTDTVYIPNGGTSVNYSLLLPPDDDEQWVIGFEITSGSRNMYYHTGYYVNDKPTTALNPMTTWDYDSAQRLYGNQSYSGIDMTIFRGNTISGTVSLPDGRIAPAGGIDIRMWSRQLTYYNGEDTAFVTIPEGGSSADYTLVTPATSFDEAWEVQYWCDSYSQTTCMNEGYLINGYYAGPHEPTFFTSRGYGLVGREDHTGIDLDLIRANAITGKLVLPEPAPTGGLMFSVYADDPVYSGAMSTSFFIPAGAKSGSYTVKIPENSTLNWRVLYRIWERAGYLETGYYSTAGTTHLQSGATLLNGAVNHSHIDMAVLPDKDNDGIPDSVDPVNNIMHPGIMLLLKDRQ